MSNQQPHSCIACLSILPDSPTDVKKCSTCGLETTWAEAPDHVFYRVSKSSAMAPPEWITNRRQLNRNKNESQNAMVDEPCVKCQNPTVMFYTMQLRSVDEGSTVFYECPKCKHKWNVNN
jgi:DNA-directed RNA polymerase I subunit RPA12